MTKLIKSHKTMLKLITKFVGSFYAAHTSEIFEMAKIECTGENQANAVRAAVAAIPELILVSEIDTSVNAKFDIYVKFH